MTPHRRKSRRYRRARQREARREEWAWREHLARKFGYAGVAEMRASIALRAAVDIGAISPEKHEELHAMLLDDVQEAER